jgi:ribosome biogenesis GTPase A
MRKRAGKQNTNITPYWDRIKQIIKESDIVLEILDARLIDYSRNQELEKMIKQIRRPVIIVVNKIDLVSKKELDLAMDKLNMMEKKEIVYVSHKRKNTIRNLISRIKKTFEKYGKRDIIEYPKKKSTHREAKADIVVGVVGYPNVGKSSIINALSFKKKAKVTSKAGTTHGAHWITASDQIKLIDSPGIIPLKYMDKTRLDLIGARDISKIKDREVVAARIIELLLKKDEKILEKHYKVKIDTKKNAYEIIEDLGLAKGHLKKGGVVDEQRTSTQIIRDWQTGKIK